MIPPLAVVLALATHSIDEDRLILCIIAKEVTPWHHSGGALGYTQDAWHEDTHDLPYSEASEPDAACAAAKVRFARAAKTLRECGYEVSVYTLASVWRHGMDGCLYRLRHKQPDDYAVCVTNLYRDKSFAAQSLQPNHEK